MKYKVLDLIELNNTQTFVTGKSDDTPFWGVNTKKLSEAVNNLKDSTGNEKLVVILAKHIKEIDDLDVNDIQQLLKITKHLGKSFQNTEAVKLLRKIYSFLVDKQENKALQNIKSVFHTTNYT